MKKIICGGILALLLITSSASAGWFGPSTYEECILKEVKGAKTSAAAVMIRKACRDKFPEPVVEITYEQAWGRKLSQDEIIKITGSLSCYSGNLSGTLHNGNDNVRVGFATIYVQGREYESYVNIPPLSTSDIKIKIIGYKNEECGWSILKAQGN